MSTSSNGDDEPMQQREESPDVWCLDSPITPDNLYAEVLTLKTMSKFDCLKSWEKEVKELRDLASSKYANQIEVERQLLDLNYAVGLFRKSLMNLNAIDWKRKRIIKDLKEEVTYLKGIVEDNTAETDMQEHYCGWNCLSIHGIPENKDEDTDALALEVINVKLEIKIKENCFERMYRIGKPKATIRLDQTLSN